MAENNNISSKIVRGSRSISVTALDAMVSVNIIFTGIVFFILADTAIVFLGISFNMTAIMSSCAAGPEVVKQLVIFEVVSFSCFLFSSLLAQGLKLRINICHNQNDDADQAMIDKRLLKYGLVGAALGLGGGCIFLMVAMLNVIRVRFRTLPCSKYSLPTAIVLIFLLSSAILMLLYAIYDATTREKPQQRKDQKAQADVAQLSAATDDHMMPLQP